MRKFSLILALVLVAVITSLALAQESVKVQMNAQSGSGQSGAVTLTAWGNQTEVVIAINAGAAGVAQPAHIHDGKCPTPGGVRYPLTSVTDGKSTTTVNAALRDLLTGNLAVNVHRSAQEVSVYVSCGDIPAAAALPRTGDNGMPLSAM